MCPADKIAPACVDKSEPKVSDEDKKSEKEPKAKCTDGSMPVCTGGVATKDKKEIMGALMCDNKVAPTCPEGGKFIDAEEEDGGRRPKCSNE